VRDATDRTRVLGVSCPEGGRKHVSSRSSRLLKTEFPDMCETWVVLTSKSTQISRDGGNDGT
jgi:hypothetical protein